MTQYITIDGAAYPVRFGGAALLDYERNTGRSAIADFQNMAGADMRLTTLVDLAMAGFRCGYASEKKPFDIDEHTVADWMVNNQNVEKLMKIFSDSFTANNDAPTADDSEKKTSH